MDNSHKYQNILDNDLIKSGAVLITGVRDELGYELVIFQSCQSSLFIQLDETLLVQSICNIVTYYGSPVISVLVNLCKCSQTYIEHFVEVISHVEKTLLNCEIKRVYIVKPEQKSNHKTLLKKLQNAQTKNLKMIAFQVVIVKNFEELHQYIKLKNLPPDFGGVLVHDLKAWINVQKMLSDFYTLVDHIINSTPNIADKIRSLVYDGGAKTEYSSEHALRKRLLKAEQKKKTLLRQCNLLEALKEGERFRSFFKDPSLNGEFYALSKTPLLDCDRVKFNVFYRKILAVKNDVETSWKDGLSRVQLMSEEQRLYNRLSEFSAWFVDYGLPYLARETVQSSDTLDVAVNERKTFENKFYKEGKDVVNKSEQALKELRSYQRSFDKTDYSSLQVLAENLTSLTENFKEKLEEQMKQYKKQNAFFEVLQKAETWYKKSKQFWPSRLEPSSHWNNTCLSPSDLTDVGQSDYDLERFLEQYPPLTNRERVTLTEHVDDVTDMELRNRARLLANRCQEVEKILRARETHLVETSGEEWTLEQKRFDALDGVDEDYQGTGNESGRKESRLMNIQRRLRDQELLYEQLKIEKDLQELDEIRNESPSPVEQKNELHRGLDRSTEREEWKSETKLRGHERFYSATRSNGAQLSAATQPPLYNSGGNIQPNSDHSENSFSAKVPMSASETFYPISLPGQSSKETTHGTLVSRYHSYPSNLRGSTTLPGNQRLCKDVLVGQQRSVSSHASYSDCSELLHDVEEKIRIAREAEKHWTRVKNEQRARLGHVIHDVNTRKEIEEVYFRAQIQLCRVRREISILEKPRCTPPGLSCPVGLPSNENPKVAYLCSEDLPGQYGAFRPYVKNVSDKKEVEQRSMNDSDSQELKRTSGQLEEKMAINFSDDEKDLGDISEPAVGMREQLLENSAQVKPRKDPGEEEEEKSSDEFDDDEEEELMILRSDSSSGHRSQDELRDSLREEQEKLEETFRQQKERFKKEQEKLKEEEEKIKEWEIREQLKEGEKSEDETAAKDVQVPDEWTETKEEQQGKFEEHEHRQRQQQKQGQIQHQQRQQQKQEQIHHQQQQKQGQIQHQQQQKQGQIQHQQQQKQGQIQHQQQQKQGQIQHQQQQKQGQIQHQQQQKQGQTQHHQQQQQKQEQIQHQQHQKQGQIQHQQQQKQGQTQLQHQEHQVEGKHSQIITTVQERNFKKNNGAHSDVLCTKTTSSLFNITHNIDVDSELAHSSHDNNYTSEKLTEEQVEVDVSSSLGNNNDVSELEQISVDHVDTDEETRQEIEEELIKILKEERSTDDEELTDEDTEIQKRTIKDELTILRPELLDVGSNFEDILKRSDSEESGNIELLNQMIDDLMIQDQGTEEGDGGVNMDHVGVHSIGEKTLDNCESNGDDISSTDVDIKFDIVSDGKKLKYDDFGLTDMLCKKEGDPEGHEERTRRSGSEESLDIKDEIIRSRYLESSDEVRDKISQDHQGTQENLKDNGNHTHDVPLENRYEDSTVIDGIGGNQKIDHGEAEGNVDSLISRKREDNINNNSVTVGDNWGERRVDNDDGASIDIDFNIDLSAEDDGAFQDGLSLIDLLRGRGQTTESEGSLEEDDDDIGIPEAEQENEDNVGYSESHRKVNDELVETSIGDIQGDNGINGENQTKGMIDDTTRLQGMVRDNGSTRSSSSKLETEDVQDVTVIDRTHGEGRGTHGIAGDKKDFQGELHLRSESERDDESDNGDFGTLLEDIEEEGSEYEDLMGTRSEHVDKKDITHNEQDDVIVMEPSTSVFRSPRFTEENINGNQNLSFSSSIIIDPGSGYCKAGFSIDEKPRTIFPSLVGKTRAQEVATGRYKDHYVGYDASRLHRVLTLQHPVQRGVVTDWDLMEKMFEYVYDELRCEAEEYPVLLSEPPLNPKTNREQIIQMMFETFHVPAAYICVQAVLALFATGKTTGLVYDCGHDVSFSVPIYEGYAIPHATKSLDLAGQSLTHCLSRMLRDRGTSLESSTELEIVQDMKEKLCYVVVDYERERKAYNTGERRDTLYRLPDGQIVMVGSERFRCPEVLFTPSIAGFESDGIQEVIYKTVMQCDIDMRKRLLNNIVLTGGSTMFSGLPRRLHVELSKLLGTSSPDALHIQATEERHLLAWQGASMLSKLSNFSSMWITQQEYEEFGPAVVHRKCI